MPYDYTQVPPPRDMELIPHGTICTVVMHIRPGGVGEDNLLMRSKDGACLMLNVEFVVVDGAFKRRKFWEYWILEGTTDGHAKSAELNRSTLRAILESSRGIDPQDESPQARERRTASLKDFGNITLIAKIGVEKGKPKNDGSGESWPDKNILAAVITPDKKDWHPVEQPPPFNGGGGAQAAPSSPASPAQAAVNKPTWA
jgi:hypothetical protein